MDSDLFGETFKNFLSNAIEESEPINKSEGKDTFNEFLQNWCKTSEELIKELRKKESMKRMIF